MEYDLTVKNILIPEVFSGDFIFVRVSDKQEFRAQEFINYNSLLNPSVIDLNSLVNEELEGQDGRIYAVNISASGQIILVILEDLQKTEAPLNEAKLTKLTVSEYQKYLKIYLNQLEQLAYFINLSSKLHKDAVQDAVDIVQTKRIEFAETKDDKVDVSGLFAVVISIVFFELGGAAFVFNEIYKAASRLSNTNLMSKLLNNLFTIYGKNVGHNNTSVIESLNKNIKTLRGEISTSIKKYITEPGNMIELLRDRSHNISVFKEINFFKHQLDANMAAKEVLIDEITRFEKKNFLTLGKSITDQIAKNKPSIKDLNKETDKLLIKKELAEATKLPTNTKVNKVSQSLSIDVYFKTFIQNKFEEALSVMDNYKLLVKDLLLDVELNTGFNKNALNLHEQFLKNFPDVEVLSSMIKEYEDLFSGDFSYSESKNYQTLEYEFIIWSLVLNNKYLEGPLTIRHLVRSFNKNAQSIKGMPPLTPHPYGELAISTPLKDYLCNRFSIENNNQYELLYYLSSNYLEIIKSTKKFNSSLEGDNQFRVGLTGYTVAMPV